MPSREGSVATSDGLRLHYEVDSPGDVEAPDDGATAPPLLCAAGGPGRASEYLGDLGGLADLRPVVRVDTRGTGRSQAPDDPSGWAIDRLVDDLEQVRLDLGAETVDVLGHSAGGPVALAYAAGHPDRVRRVVLVTSYVDFSADREEERRALREARADEPWYAEAADAAEGMPYARPAEQQRLSRLQRPFYYGVWNERTQAHAAAADHQMTPRAETAISVALREVAHRVDALLAMDRPTLVVAGALDVITPPSGVRALAEALPAARFVALDGLGHFPWVDGPQQFVETVEAFLSAPDPAAPEPDASEPDGTA